MTKKALKTKTGFANQVSSVKDKLKKIKELRSKINSLKHLYQEHDALMEEILPLFIEIQADKFIIAREIKLSGQTFKLSPFFYDEKKGQLVAKSWKSTAFPVASIE